MSAADPDGAPGPPGLAEHIYGWRARIGLIGLPVTTPSHAAGRAIRAGEATRLVAAGPPRGQTYVAYAPDGPRGR